MAQRWQDGSSMPPLGILYLAAVLEQHGHQVEVIPCDILDYTLADVRRIVAASRPDLVGCTATTENRFDSFELIRTVKAVDAGIVTVLGGPHISMAREDTVMHLKELDYAVIGEGEFTLLELVNTLERGGDPAAVSGLVMRRDGQVIFTGAREAIPDLDVLPMPARHLIPMERYNFFVTDRNGRKRKAQNIMTSRGCPFNCYFCATPVNWGRKMRGFSTGRVIEEMRFLIDHYGAEFIWFYDDTLNYQPGRLHDLLDRIIAQNWDIRFCNEFRIDLIDRPTLEKMMRAGLDFGFFGIEAGNSRIRREVVQKKFDVELAYQFVRWAGELGFTANAFLIFSHFTESWREALESIAIMKRLQEINPETEITTAILHIYPGTQLEKIARDQGLFPKDFSWTRKSDMKRVHVLPAAQGHVPLFKHRLSWFQIADLVMRWSATKKKLVSSSKIRQALSTLGSFKDLYIYGIFFLVMIKYKLKKLIRPGLKSSLGDDIKKVGS